MEDTTNLNENKIVNLTFNLNEEILDILKRLLVSSFNVKFCSKVLEKQKDFLNEIKNSLNLIHEHPFEEDIEDIEDKLKNLIDTFNCLVKLRRNQLHNKKLFLKINKLKN